MADKKNSRTRNWVFILYPESCPENYVEILDQLCIDYVISPLHDRDINPDGTPKKNHFHVALLYDTVKSFDQVCEDLEPLNVPIPERIKSVKGQIRYFAHLDNPEKAQYNIYECRVHGSISLDDLLLPSSSECAVLFEDMIAFISENNIIEYSTFLDYCRIQEKREWMYIATRVNTLALTRYISSLRHRQGKGRIEDEA